MYARKTISITLTNSLGWIVILSDILNQLLAPFIGSVNRTAPRATIPSPYNIGEIFAIKL